MPNVGLSFSPTQAPNPYGQNGQGRMAGPVNPVMDAIKILSFRVPQLLGQSAPVAPGLLAGAGGASPGGNDTAMLQQWLQRFFGGGLNQAAGPMPSNTGEAPTGRPAIVFGGGGGGRPLDQTWGDLGGAQRTISPAASMPGNLTESAPTPSPGPEFPAFPAY